MSYMIITSGIAALLTLTPILMLVYMLLRNHGLAILCMECQQCRAVCPVLAVNEEYIGPKEVMVAAKSGKYDTVLKKHLELCTSCAACMERCPRGLDVDETVTEIFSSEITDIIRRDTIDYIQKVPNPKMQRTFEAVIRRFEGKKINLPWDWVKKTFRLRKFYNPIEDKARKPPIKEHIDGGGSELKELGGLLFGEGDKKGDEVGKGDENSEGSKEGSDASDGKVAVNEKQEEKPKEKSEADS